MIHFKFQILKKRLTVSSVFSPNKGWSVRKRTNIKREFKGKVQALILASQKFHSRTGKSNSGNKLQPKYNYLA